MSLTSEVKVMIAKMLIYPILVYTRFGDILLNILDINENSYALLTNIHTYIQIDLLT